MSKKILIVEDEISLRESLKQGLKESGFNVLEAGNGEVGLDIAMAEHPDLILLDIIMPVMDGLTMLKKLRKDKWGKNVPVIVLTVLQDDKKVVEALDNGVFDFLVKVDWSIEDVIKKINEKLKLGAEAKNSE